MNLWYIHQIFKKTSARQRYFDENEKKYKQNSDKYVKYSKKTSQAHEILYEISKCSDDLWIWITKKRTKAKQRSANERRIRRRNPATKKKYGRYQDWWPACRIYFLYRQGTDRWYWSNFFLSCAFLPAFLFVSRWFVCIR